MFSEVLDKRIKRTELLKNFKKHEYILINICIKAKVNLQHTQVNFEKKLSECVGNPEKLQVSPKCFSIYIKPVIFSFSATKVNKLFTHNMKSLLKVVQYFFSKI